MNDDNANGANNSDSKENLQKPKLNLPTIPKIEPKANPFGGIKPIVATQIKTSEAEPKIEPTPTKGMEEDSAPTEAMTLDELYALGDKQDEEPPTIEVDGAALQELLDHEEEEEDPFGSFTDAELGDNVTELEDDEDIISSLANDDDPLKATYLEDPDKVEIDLGPPTDNLDAEDLQNMIIPPMREDDPLPGNDDNLIMSSTAHAVFDEPMVEEATSLLDMSEGVLLGSQEDANLDDFEDDGATMVFDSFSGQPISSLQAPQTGPRPQQSTLLGMQAPQIQAQAPQPLHHTPQPQHQPIKIEQPVASSLQDDFTSQATEVLQSPFERDLVVPKLRFLDGPTKDHESFITGIKGTFGRGENNTNMVADLALSRNHFEIIKQPDESYLIRDLNSSNGTKLNGTLIKEAAIFHGDRVEAGKSSMIFECEDAVARPQRHFIPAVNNTLMGTSQMEDHTTLAALQIDQTTRLLTRVSIAAGILCVPLIVALLGLSMRSPTVDASTNNKTSLVQQNKAKEASKLYLKGVDAVSSRDWDLARSYFKRANVLDANMDVSAQIKLIQREQLAQKALGRATALAAQDKQNEVNQLVSTIPSESVYFEDAQKLRRQQRREDLNQLYKDAQTQLTNDELDKAQASAQNVLKLSPQHAGAKTLLVAIGERRTTLEKQREKEAQANANLNTNTNDTPKTNINPFDKPIKVNTPIKTNGQGNLSEGLAFYKRGRFSDAAKVFDSVPGSKGKRLARETRQLQSNLRNGKNAYKKGQWSKAISTLTRARTADGRIGNAYKKELSGMLATSHANIGLAFVKKGQNRNARKSLVAGKRFQSNGKTRELSQALENKAKSLYIKAANAKKSNPNTAISFCRQIMLMVPSSSPTWKKAQRLMLEL